MRHLPYPLPYPALGSTCPGEILYASVLQNTSIRTERDIEWSCGAKQNKLSSVGADSARILKPPPPANPRATQARAGIVRGRHIRASQHRLSKHLGSYPKDGHRRFGDEAERRNCRAA